MTDVADAVAPSRSFSVRDYLIGSTIVSIFAIRQLYTGVLDFHLADLIVIINCMVLITCNRLVVHPYHVALLVLLFCVSFLAASLSGYPTEAALPQIIGIAVYSIYHYSIMALRRGSVASVFGMYCTFTLWMAAFGILKFFVPFLVGGPVDRLTSVFYEPSNFIGSTLPAMSYFTIEAIRHRRHVWSFLLMLITYVLADSTLGYFGLAVTVLLVFPIRSIFGIMAGLVLGTLVLWGVYTYSDNFRLRVNDTMNAQFTAEAATTVQSSDDIAVAKTNASTLALLSNAYVAYRSFQQSPVLGTGLDTHRFSYARYAPEILPPNGILFGLNSLDAASLFLRVTSDLGLFGLCLMAAFLIYFSRVRGELYVLLRNCFLPYYCVKLLRSGHYFLLEFWFFNMIYVFNYLEYRASRNGGSARAHS